MKIRSKTILLWGALPPTPPISFQPPLLVVLGDGIALKFMVNIFTIKEVA